MEIRNYETVFIMTPVLSEDQVEGTVAKYRKMLLDSGAEIVHEDKPKLQKLAYPIKNKSTGIYNIVEFKATSSIVAPLEKEYKRDENIMRFLTTVLDKHAIKYNENKRMNGGREESKGASPIDSVQESTK